MTAPAFRVALIGYGLGGARFHAPLIAATPGLNLAAIVTRDPVRRERAQRDHLGVRLFDSADDLWRDAANFDLVAISSPNRTHAPLALAALGAGLNVVVDKPFAATAAGAREIAAEATRRGLMVSPFQNRRWDSDMLTVRRLIADGRLGDVFRFESRFERWRAVAKPRWTSPDAADAAEGIMYDLGTHLVDQALVLFGSVRDVYAEADCRHPDVRVEDDATIALTHASGVRSHLVMSAVAALSGPRMSVYGSRGTYIKFGLDPQEDALAAGARPGDAGWGEEPPERWGKLHDGTTETQVASERGAYENYYAGIADSLATGAPPPVAADDAIASLAVIDAAHRSAVTRAVVPLASPA
jgi:scyllo-inositol 2-dehydrogenase (NADP+)